MPDGTASGGTPALESLFRPRSVAVIGASADPLKFGGKVVINIFNSQIERRYCVNGKGGEVMGEKAYGALADLPEVPEVVVLAVPADAALDALEEAGARGTRAAVMFASGFNEAGGEGQARTVRLRGIAQRYGMAVIGPNCVGVASFADGTYLCSVDGLQAGEAGKISLIAQSGSLGIAVSSRNRGRFRHLITTGNETVTTAAAILRHLVENDAKTDVYALLMEAIRDPEMLAEAVAAARDSGRQVVMLKLSGGEASGRIAALHTGAVSGDSAPLEAFCRDHGIVLAPSLRNFNAALNLLGGTGYRAGRRLGVFTTSGGTAVKSAGLAEEHDLEMPQPSPEAATKISEILGMPADRVTNPLDTTGIHAFDAARFGAALAVFAEDGKYDLVLTPLGGAGGDAAAARVDTVVATARAASVPIVPVWQMQRLMEEDAFQRLYASGLPLFTDYEGPIEVMDLLSQPAPGVLRADVHHGPGAEPVGKALGFIAAHGAPVAAYRVLGDDLEDALQALGTSVALKASHPAILHKSDAGLVAFPLSDVAKLREARDAMRRTVAGMGLSEPEFIVQEGVVGRVELICGFQRDAELGPYVVIGAGGIYTEILRDSVAVLVQPQESLATRIEAAMKRLRIWPILEGTRGQGAADWPSAITAIERLAYAFVSGHDIAGMEINPLVVRERGQGAKVVDARIIRS